MSRHIPSEIKEAIIKQAVGRKDSSLLEIATANNIGYSTLQAWLSSNRTGESSSCFPVTTEQGISKSQRFKHLLATANLDEEAVGVYCREQGIYSHQLTQWQEKFMNNSNDKIEDRQKQSLRALKQENKALKKELQRKDKALAETSALLILKKKASLIWGEPEVD